MQDSSIVYKERRRHIETLLPVSYTHLDVYKRQSLLSVEYLDVWQHEQHRRIVYGLLCVHPVSYTHLDVYKRQTQYCSCVEV